MLGPKIERWRALVEKEMSTGGYPWPSELVLSVMRYESGGQAGNVNQKSGASGLLQVMPGTLKHFNQATGNDIPLSSLRGQSQQDAQAQIHVGMWVLGRYWRSAARWLRRLNGPQADLPLEDLARFGSAFYVAGPGNIQRRAPADRPLTWKDWERKFPKANSTAYCNRIWNKVLSLNPTWNLAAIDKWIGKPPDVTIPPPPPLIAKKSPVIGMLVAMLILSIGYWMMKSKDKKTAQTS